MRGVAADVGAGQPELLAQEVDQQQARLDLRVVRRPVHGDPDLVLCHGYRPPARSTASFKARVASTRAISRLYSTEPRRSALGDAAFAARCAASARLAASGRLPVRNFSASAALIGVGPTLVSARPSPLDRPAGSESDLRRRRRRRVVPHLALELEVRAARARRRDRDADLGEDLVRPERGAEQPEEELLDRDHPLALRSGGHHLRAEREHRGRVVVARVAVGQVAADRRHVAHQRVGDHLRGVVEDRVAGPDRARTAPARTRACVRRSGGSRPPRGCTRARECARCRPGGPVWPRRSFSSGSRLCPPESTLASSPYLDSRASASGSVPGAW